jgi:hypothetical protein
MVNKAVVVSLRKSRRDIVDIIFYVGARALFPKQSPVFLRGLLRLLFEYDVARNDILPLNRMAGMTIRGRLIQAILRASAAHHRPESENLSGGFANKLIRSIGQNARVPQRLAFTGDENRITDFQVNDRVELRQSKRDIVYIS